MASCATNCDSLREFNIFLRNLSKHPIYFVDPISVIRYQQDFTSMILSLASKRESQNSKSMNTRAVTFPLSIDTNKKRAGFIATGGVAYAILRSAAK